ncbi:AIR carboxylase family protein [Shigella boydii]
MIIAGAAAQRICRHELPPKRWCRCWACHYTGRTDGVDSLYSMVRMPRGIPVGTLAIFNRWRGKRSVTGSTILSTHDKELHQRLNDWRKAQTDEVLENPDREVRHGRQHYVLVTGSSAVC